MRTNLISLVLISIKKYTFEIDILLMVKYGRDNFFKLWEEQVIYLVWVTNTLFNLKQYIDTLQHNLSVAQKLEFENKLFIVV